jgi:transposase, IS5 family
MGHLKHDSGMDRCWLMGQTGDALHPVLCAAGDNIRWLLRAVLRKGMKVFYVPLRAWLTRLKTALATVWGARHAGRQTIPSAVG